MKSFNEIQYCLRNPRIHIREHSTRTLKFKLEATLISSAVHVPRRQRVIRGSW